MPAGVKAVLVPGLHIVVAVGVLIAAFPALRFLNSDHPGWSVAPLGYAVVIVAVQVTVLAAGWGILLARANGGRRPGFALVARSFVLGWLARYLPGPPTGPAGKYFAVRSAGWPAGGAGAALFYENLLQMGAGLVLPALTVGFVLGAGWLWVTPIAVTLGVGLTMLAVSPPVVSRLGRLAARAGLKSAIQVEVLPFRRLLAPMALFGAAAFLATAAFHVVVVTVSPAPVGDFGRSVFIFGLASAVGYIVPLAPSGAGVREAIIVALLGPEIGGPEALSVAVVARATSVALDVLLGLCLLGSYAVGAARSRLRRGAPPPTAANTRA